MKMSGIMSVNINARNKPKMPGIMFRISFEDLNIASLLTMINLGD